jgi:hypothetical protein
LVTSVHAVEVEDDWGFHLHAEGEFERRDAGVEFGFSRARSASRG